jgi:hypothetical protein
VPSSINLIMMCTHNEERYSIERKRRVDAQTQVASFGDQELVIPIIKARQGGAGEEAAQMRDNQVFNLKLLAVNESKQKLIGLYKLKVHTKNFEACDHKRVTFDKCIDKEGALTFSTALTGSSLTKTKL